MVQYTSKAFKYLQKVFCITKCLTSNVTMIIQIKIKYCSIELEAKKVEW